PRERAEELEDERGLADARWPGEQHDRPGHQPTAEDAVEARHAGDDPGLADDRTQLLGRELRPGRRAPRDLLDRAPRLTCGAPTRPLRQPLSAGRTGERDVNLHTSDRSRGL